MKTFLSLILAASGLLAQTTVNISLSVPDDVLASVNAWRLSKGTAVILNVAVDATATSLTLNDATPVLVGSVLILDAEQATVTAVNGKVVTVTRKTGGTAAAAHAAGQPVLVLTYGTQMELLKTILRSAVSSILKDSPTPAMVAAAADAKAKADAAAAVDAAVTSNIR